MKKINGLLQSFCTDEKEGRGWGYTPFLQNGYVYATDFHVLIRVHPRLSEVEYDENPKASSMSEPLCTDGMNSHIVKVSEISKLLQSIPKIEEMTAKRKSKKCEECGGEGMVEWEYKDYEEHFECPVCKGEGYQGLIHHDPKRDDPGIHPVGGNYLTEAVDWFKKNDIPLYGINENPEQKSWTTSPKAYCQLYIDDAALGIPLIHPREGRPFVWWRAVESKLVNLGVLNATDDDDATCRE